jgi:hypothetical protein
MRADLAIETDSWSSRNPFNVTKATDLTDSEIQRMWVDLGADGGYQAVIDPTVPMPRILLGGKGTGRTHLMRFLSAPVQRLRNPGSAYSGPIGEGYLGVYLRCTGLNAGRFQGKGISDETWGEVFTYSMDLWLARVALDTALSTFASLSTFDSASAKIAEEIASIFDDYGKESPGDLGGLKADLQAQQAELDLAVNNAALNRDLGDLKIRVSRGRLPFEIPQIVKAHVPEIAEMSWLYLIDELENLTLNQQKYIQTLIRERVEPASLIVGSRTYGFRTKETLSAGEENKAGSEYEPVELDHIYLENPKAFATFCREIVAKRLADAGYNHIVAENLDAFFYEPDQDGGARDEEVAFVRARNEPERKYFQRLKGQLEKYRQMKGDEAQRLIENLRVPQHPLIERLNVLILYQSWTRKDDLLDRAKEIGEESKTFVEGAKEGNYQTSYGHWSGDVLARLLQEYQEKQRYLGLKTFIRMAGGLPRNLLIILKNVVRAAEFNGEVPFRDAPIEEGSQRAGVIRAADWFYRDGRAMGDAGVKAEKAINRIGDLLRALRFADKPPEVSLSSFSLSFDALDSAGKQALETARDWSLLIEVKEGQRDKNTAAIKQKYQLNPMLCPRWDLPIGRRGALPLGSQDAKAVFSEQNDEAFDRMRRTRVARATVPFRAEKKEAQETLLADGD